MISHHMFPELSEKNIHPSPYIYLTPLGLGGLRWGEKLC